MSEKYQEITKKELKLSLQYDSPRKGDVMRHLADISHARKILGYKPTISLDEGIERYIKWRLSGGR
jgi:nucleoside-diphosphate-sugar epimerase